jgi:Ala-tRNA(Pro) deacylase
MTDAERQVYETLDALGIGYARHEHPPVFTVEQADEHWRGIDAAHCKNLFLRNKKGSAHYLVVAERSTPIDIRRLTAKLGEDRLSFASAERLQAHLGLSPGAVSPFGLLNDNRRAVTVVLDDSLRLSPRVAFHPNVNTATIALSFEDFERFLAWCGNPLKWVSFRG